MEERSGGRAVDGREVQEQQKQDGRRLEMEERKRRKDLVDGWWTSCGRAGAAEIAWEEARDGGARLKVRMRWTGGGRAGGAEIAWEEARDVWDVVAGVLCRGVQKRYTSEK